jgi:predicted site-specific integrase-resolvase
MEVFKTGKVAEICGVAQRTVIKWFDEGRFENGYTLPGSGDRRIPRESLEKFMEANRFPMDKLPRAEEASK